MLRNEIQDLPELGVSADKLGETTGEVRREVGWNRSARGQLGDQPARRACRARPDDPGELVAASGNRSDQVVVCAKCPAQSRNLVSQSVLFDDPAWPYSVQQHVLADDGPAGLNQRYEQVERSSAELDRPAVGEQFAAMWFERVAAELDARRRVKKGEPSASILRGTEENSSVLQTRARPATRLRREHLEFQNFVFQAKALRGSPRYVLWARPTWPALKLTQGAASRLTAAAEPDSAKKGRDGNAGWFWPEASGSDQPIWRCPNALLHHTSIQNQRDDYRLVFRQ